MNGGTIFVLCLAAAFLFLVIFLARLGRISRQQEETREKSAPPLKKAS